MIALIRRWFAPVPDCCPVRAAELEAERELFRARYAAAVAEGNARAAEDARRKAMAARIAKVRREGRKRA